MIVCPLCAHPQPPAAECAVCGKVLAEHGGLAPTVTPVDGLEPTRLDADPFVLAERMPDLEPTGHGPAAAPPGAPVPDVEPTAAAPVHVAAAVIPDLVPTAAEGLPDDGPAAAPSLVVCRYCRSPAMPGERICAHCGMRLPVSAVGAPDAAAAVHRCSCGAPVSGSLCPACGARRRDG